MKIAYITIGLVLASASAFALVDSIFLGFTLGTPIAILGMVMGAWAMVLGDE